MDQRRQLIYFPPRILDRARREVDSPESSFERLNDLVVEALGQYLDELDAAGSNVDEAASAGRQPEPLRHPSGVQSATSIPADLLGLSSLEPAVRAAFSRLEEQILGYDRALLALAGPDTADGDEQAEGLVREILDWTAISPPTREPKLIEGGGSVPPPNPKEPVFGLHNRDYPSLWALQLLARATADGPILFSEFASALELAARSMGGMLRELDHLPGVIKGARVGLKHSTSFPKKDDGGSTGTQWLPSRDGSKKIRLYPFVKNNFARIQGSSRKGGGTEATGPLPAWRAIAFEEDGHDYRVGLTPEGAELLEMVRGVSLSLPHSPEQALGFLDYLTTHAPGDAEALKRVLKAIAGGPNRTQLIAANRRFFYSFVGEPAKETENRYAATMTQGYVSRGREWGLVSPELAKSSSGKREIYSLTEAGDNLYRKPPT